jgi:hypothetical protein
MMVYRLWNRYFQPDYTVSIKPVEGFDFKQDVPVILDGVTIQDDYEGDLATRRVLIYQLDFTMKMKFYGPTNDVGLIREINIDFEKFGTNNDSNKFEEMDFTVGSTDTEDDYTVTVTINNNPNID